MKKLLGRAGYLLGVLGPAMTEGTLTEEMRWEFILHNEKSEYRVPESERLLLEF